MKSSGLWIRSLAAILDFTIVSIIWYFVIETWGTFNAAGDKELVGLGATALMTGTAAFWIVPEWLTGATFGKWSCDLCVVNMSGNKISLAQSVKRNGLRLIDFFPWYLTGFIAANLTPSRQRLGDLWAKTLVVKRSELARQTVLASHKHQTKS
jgi:uncharacterized RDD family membrane protein YckC